MSMIRKGFYITQQIENDLKEYCSFTGESESTVLRLSLTKFLKGKKINDLKNTNKKEKI